MAKRFQSFLRECKDCVFQCGSVSMCLRHHYHFASYHHIISHSITSYIIFHQLHKNGIRNRFSEKNVKVTRRKLRIIASSACTQKKDLFLRSMDIFILRTTYLLSLRSMKRREGVFSLKAQKRYVCKFHAS
jgi:hypothetical protein